MASAILDFRRTRRMAAVTSPGPSLAFRRRRAETNRNIFRPTTRGSSMIRTTTNGSSRTSTIMRKRKRSSHSHSSNPDCRTRLVVSLTNRSDSVPSRSHRRPTIWVHLSTSPTALWMLVQRTISSVLVAVKTKAMMMMMSAIAWKPRSKAPSPPHRCIRKRSGVPVALHRKCGAARCVVSHACVTRCSSIHRVVSCAV